MRFTSLAFAALSLPSLAGCGLLLDLGPPEPEVELDSGFSDVVTSDGALPDRSLDDIAVDPQPDVDPPPDAGSDVPEPPECLDQHRELTSWSVDGRPTVDLAVLGTMLAVVYTDENGRPWQAQIDFSDAGGLAVPVEPRPSGSPIRAVQVAPHPGRGFVVAILRRNGELDIGGFPVGSAETTLNGTAVAFGLDTSAAGSPILAYVVAGATTSTRVVVGELAETYRTLLGRYSAEVTTVPQYFGGISVQSDAPGAYDVYAIADGDDDQVGLWHMQLPPITSLRPLGIRLGATFPWDSIEVARQLQTVRVGPVTGIVSHLRGGVPLEVSDLNFVADGEAVWPSSSTCRGRVECGLDLGPRSIARAPNSMGADFAVVDAVGGTLHAGVIRGGVVVHSISIPRGDEGTPFDLSLAAFDSRASGFTHALAVAQRNKVTLFGLCLTPPTP